MCSFITERAAPVSISMVVSSPLSNRYSDWLSVASGGVEQALYSFVSSSSSSEPVSWLVDLDAVLSAFESLVLFLQTFEI